MDEELMRIIHQDGYAQVLVELAVNVGMTKAAAAEMQTSMADMFLDPSVTGGRPPGTVLTSELADGLSFHAKVGLKHIANAEQLVGPPRVRIFPNLGLALGYVDAAGLAGLGQAASVGRVFRAEMPNLIRPVRARADVAPNGISWGVQRIGAPALWAMGFRGQGVLVGHVDTGVDGRHPALQGAIQHFVEFDLNGEEMPEKEAWDSDDHGTHTAGTIAGRQGTFGAFGVAPEAKIASAMVIEGGNVLDRILGGIEWSVDKGAQIVSASLGLPGQSQVFQPLINALRRRNVLPVFAVGNEGPGTSRYPGNYSNLLSVGASDSGDNVAGFSGSQRFLNPPRMVPDIVAPGANIISCIPGGNYARLDGTSMATPHIAGLAALLLSAVPGASANDLEAAIQDAAQLVGGMSPQRANRGIPDGSRALALLQQRLDLAP